MERSGHLDIEDARRAVLGAVAPLPPVTLELDRALGRVLAEEVVSEHALPPFDSSAMDGFSVIAKDVALAAPSAPVSLTLVDESAAGHPAQATLAPGQAIAISTGAVIPAGADAVVRVEDTRRRDRVVEVLEAVRPGADIRRSGEDVLAGTRVLSAGAVLGAAELGVLASLGRAHVRCASQPRVSVLVTGDELLDVREPLRPGAIRDSNSHTLLALARSAGAHVLRAERVPDQADAVREAIGAAAGDSDALILCGGVSVGEHDHVRACLRELGAKRAFWGLALKPGHPTWFGTLDDTLVFGLPGNPVSAMVTFALLAAPALLAMQGLAKPCEEASAILDESYEKPAGRTHALRCHLSADADGWHAHITGPQGSHVLTSMLGADALAIVPSGVTRVAAGERVSIVPLAPVGGGWLRLAGEKAAGGTGEPARASLDNERAGAETSDRAGAIKLGVKLFAMLRERAGADQIELRLPAGASAADALQLLGEHEALREPLSRLAVVLAVNREYAKPETKLQDGDELALIPPLSGGAQIDPGVRISAEPLSRERARAAVAHPRAGAIVVFEGVTREVPALHYEAYTAMAQERIERIVREVAQAHGLCAATAEHRVGEVPLGEPSVIVAVSAPHRAEAFAGAREAIDKIKAQAPIWKRELSEADVEQQPADGSDVEQRPAGGWVQGTPAPTGPAPTAPAPAAPTLTHLDRDGSARMVDVGGKPASERVARARARVRMSAKAAAAVQAGNGPKGEVLGTARIAGIQAAKQTSALIPLAHPLPLSFLDVRASVDVQAGVVELVSEARTVARTGVEMEAMAACAVAALTVYDMVKGIERGIEVEQVVLLEKRGGRSDYRHPDL